MSPYATAATMTNNPIFSTVALSNSLVPSVPTSRASTSSINNIAGTSISIVTSSGVPSTSSNAGARPSSTTPNVAQRHDLSRSAIQGVAVALLGLALYLWAASDHDIASWFLMSCMNQMDPLSWRQQDWIRVCMFSNTWLSATASATRDLQTGLGSKYFKVVGI